jgi:hypothetical protein
MKYQYTITGKIIKGPGIDDTAGYLKRLELSEGSPVSYTFIIDLLVVGFKKQSDGLIVPVQPGGSLPTFYARYVSGTTWTSATYLPSHDGIVELNHGVVTWLKLYPAWGERGILIGNGNNYLAINDMGEQPKASGRWPLNSSFGSGNMSNTIYDAAGKKSRFHFEAKISEVWGELT